MRISDWSSDVCSSDLRDYIDSNSEPTGSGGAEDADYLGLDPARRVPNNLMASVTGLLAVKGMTPALYGKLAPYLCALPTVGTTIHVNTASPLLMHALTPIGRTSCRDRACQTA